VYAIGRDGIAKKSLDDRPKICDRSSIPSSSTCRRRAPKSTGDLQLLVTNIDYNDYVGRLAIGRIFQGEIRAAQDAVICKIDGSTQPFRVNAAFRFRGLGPHAD
jgi:GTP-binding protein